MISFDDDDVLSIGDNLNPEKTLMDQKALADLLYALKHLKSQISVDNQDRSMNDSVLNMREYLNLRKHDYSDLQDELTRYGLSSLGRSQAHITATIDAAIRILSLVLGEIPPAETPTLSYDKAHRIMKKNGEIFSKSSKKTKIMITVPSNYRELPEWFARLADEGVNIFRINTAHDTPDVWKQMAEMVQLERKQRNKDLKIYVDLAGPKIRTVNVGAESSTLKLGSKKENREFFLAPASDIQKPREGNQPVVYVDDHAFQDILSGCGISILDIDGQSHPLSFLKAIGPGIKVSASEKFLVSQESIARICKNDESYDTPLLYPSDSSDEVRVFAGNTVMIVPSEHHKSDKRRKKHRYDALIGCTLGGVSSLVRTGEKVFLDDGKIEMVIEAVEGENIICKVLTRKKNGVVIKEEKGINFPSSRISVSAMSDRDKEIFPHVCEFADIIGISFAQTEQDIRDVVERLESIGKQDEIAVVAKIETQKGVENLPSILEALIRYGRSGIMIARGDLAIEIGYENLAYMQEEILDLCAAAHTPVILATQVLENKMKTNIPSRAEITDAAFAHKAECVMLNKGEYALETIKILNAIFTQMDLVFRKNKLLLNPNFQWK